jgi:hypothetical protein
MFIPQGVLPRIYCCKPIVLRYVTKVTPDSKPAALAGDPAQHAAFRVRGQL